MLLCQANFWVLFAAAAALAGAVLTPKLEFLHEPVPAAASYRILLLQASTRYAAVLALPLQLVVSLCRCFSGPPCAL